MSINKKIPISLKVGLASFSLGLILLSVLFLFLIPNINKDQYDNASNQMTQMSKLTKHQIRLIVDYFREYRTFEKDKSKRDIQSYFEKIQLKYDNVLNYDNDSLKKDLHYINDNYNCSVSWSNKDKELLNLKHPKSKEGYDFNQLQYNTWKHLDDKHSFCPHDTYHAFKTKIDTHEIQLFCNNTLEKNYKNVEHDVKKIVQDGFSLTQNIHHGKVYLMWLDNQLDKNELTKTMDELKNGKDYCLSRISDFTTPMTGEIPISEILDVQETKVFNHKLNGKDTITWVSKIYSYDDEDFVFVLSAYEDDFQKSLESPLLKIVSISILALLISVLMGFILFRKWLKNIEALSITARNICNGNINLRSKIKGDDDIGILGVAFDSMLDKLEDNIKNLDAKVEQRTQELEESLQAKEILLKEIHHRVKNNLSLTINFIKLQKFKLKDSNLQQVLGDMERRIHTMALLHSKLYESDNLESIHLKKYIKDLSNDIMRSYSTSNKITLNLNIDDTFVNIDYALPCGLIINECLTNSIKYAFDDEEGCVNISLRTEDKYILLEVSDSGKGLKKDFDIFKAETLGLQLITTIVQTQLLGSIDYLNDNGTKYMIKFEQKIV